MAAAAAALALTGCRERATGPIRVVAIGAPPVLANPNLTVLSPASGLLLQGAAQGLVRFDAAGEIEPALAQSWIVSDDGRRYTFRLRRALWTRGAPVTAQQVVARLQAIASRGSRNPLKPVLGAIEEAEAMTDQVLEVRLKTARPNFLQLLAQPEMAILLNGQGTGPYRIGGPLDGAVRLVPPPAEDEEDETARAPDILISAESADRAVARFAAGEADLVTGGTIGEVPLLAAANPPANQLAFDPAAGLFGLAFLTGNGPLADPVVRRALSMAIDRAAIIERFAVPGFSARTSLLPPDNDELPNSVQPEWTSAPMPVRREFATQLLGEALAGVPLRLRVGVPDGYGYRLVFAHLRRDWRAIGVEAVEVPAAWQAELRLIDEVAPAELATWYLRRFSCGTSPVCDETATEQLEAARNAAAPPERRALLAQVDSALTGITAFIPIGSPVRWSLRSPRLNGFRANVFARHAPTELIAGRR